jgi:hypothetical protein
MLCAVLFVGLYARDALAIPSSRGLPTPPKKTPTPPVSSVPTRTPTPRLTATRTPQPTSTATPLDYASRNGNIDRTAAGAKSDRAGGDCNPGATADADNRTVGDEYTALLERAHA